MARYRVTIDTERNARVSRLGRNHIETHACGWNKGIKVICDSESIKVYETGGSRNPSNKNLICELYD